jgi:hypothetical protein
MSSMFGVDGVIRGVARATPRGGDARQLAPSATVRAVHRPNHHEAATPFPPRHTSEVRKQVTNRPQLADLSRIAPSMLDEDTALLRKAPIKSPTILTQQSNSLRHNFPNTIA